MLQWWSSQSQSDGHANDDAPETPAPLFAVRAFKHALFGTPKPEEQRVQQLRRSCSEEVSRPVPMKTWQDRAKDDVELLSPTKRGILLTPGGTGSTRRKTVSFGSQLEALRLGDDIPPKPTTTPKAIPGKFPSPWTSKSDGLSSISNTAQAPRARIHRVSSMPELVANTPSEAPREPASPRAATAHWKSQYDALSARHATEMRKATKKEQIAKKYAKFKDGEAARLAVQLETEQAKALKLEKKLADYVARLAAALSNQQSAVPTTTITKHPTSPDRADAALQEANLRIEALSRSKAALKSTLDQARASANAQARAYEARIAALERETRDLRAEARGGRRVAGGGGGGVGVGDIWADLGVEEEEVRREDADPTADGAAAGGRPNLRRSARRSPRKGARGGDVGVLAVADGNVDASLAERSPAGKVLGGDESARTEGMGGVEWKGQGQGLTEARREAAKRRLEEKRRQRGAA